VDSRLAQVNTPIGRFGVKRAVSAAGYGALS